MSELSLPQLTSRSISSLILLISRSGYMQLISTAGVFFLTLFLTPVEFGLFFIVNEIIGLMAYFSDVGLAASLIQKHETPSIPALRTSFTIQQVLIFTLILIVGLITNGFSQMYNLDSAGQWWQVRLTPQPLQPEGIFLLRAVVVGFILASLKTIPSVLLERVLQFNKLVIVETIETIIFYSIAVYYAWSGYGAVSYAYAVLARGVIGVILIYYLAPWPIGFAFNLKETKDLFSFGLPYQGNTLIAAIKDRLLNLFLAGTLGQYGMGLIGWSQTWSQKSLRFVSDNITKVTFPAFSRLQNDQPKLIKAIDRMLFFSAITIFPVLVGTGVIAQPLLQLIPTEGYPSYYDKWQPAFIAFYLYLYNSGWAAISTPLTNTLAAIGRIRTVTRLMIMWTVLTWGIIAPLGYLYGYVGVALGVAIVANFSIIPIWLLYRHVPFHPLQNIMPPLVASAAMGISVYIITRALPVTWITISMSICAAITIYSGILYTLAGPRILSYAQIFISAIKKK